MNEICEICGEAVEDGEDVIFFITMTVHATCWGSTKDTCAGCGRPIEYNDTDVVFGTAYDSRMYHGQCYKDFEIEGQKETE